MRNKSADARGDIHSTFRLSPVMRAVVLVALIGALVAAASAMDLESQILEQLWAYEATQNGMNATATANLFTENGVANAPLGANTVCIL